MIFKITHWTEDIRGDVGDEGYDWALEKADGEVITRGPHSFPTEKACRSQIAQAKRSMKGAMRCKVVTLDG